MDRLTRSIDGGDSYVVDDDRIDSAINKLAIFENICDNLISRQIEIPKELEKLRSEDKTHTVKFKQLFAEKLTDNYIIRLFESYGLK